jgi:hypothetical protein
MVLSHCMPMEFTIEFNWLSSTAALHRRRLGSRRKFIRKLAVIQSLPPSVSSPGGPLGVEKV